MANGTRLPGDDIIGMWDHHLILESKACVLHSKASDARKIWGMLSALRLNAKRRVAPYTATGARMPGCGS
jgi:hypothetical protein